MTMTKEGAAYAHYLDTLHNLQDSVKEMVRIYFLHNDKPFFPNSTLLEFLRDEVDLVMIKEIMKKARGNVSRAAKISRITRPTLHDKIKKYGLSDSNFDKED